MVLLLEALAEILRHVESHHVGNLGNIQLQVVPQQEGGTFQADGHDEVGRCLSGDGLQLGEELGARDVHLRHQHVHVELPVVHLLLDDFHHPVHELLVHHVVRQHLRALLRQLAELLLQDDAVVHQVVAAGKEDVDVERFGDIVVRPQAQALEVVLHGGLGRQQDDGDMAGLEVGLDGLAQLGAGHSGQDDVAEHDVRALRPHLFQSLPAVGGGDDGVELLEHLHQHLLQGVVVLHNQYLVFPLLQADVVLRSLPLGGQGMPAADVRLVGEGRLLGFGQLLGGEVPVPGRQVYAESGTFARFAGHFDAAMVQLDDALGEREADARALRQTGVLLLRLVEAREDVFDVLGRYPGAVVGHFDEDLLVPLPDGEGDDPSFRGVLEGVGYQVVDHLLHLPRVVPEVDAVTALLEVERDAPLCRVFLEEEVVPVDEVHDVMLAHLDGHVALFLLAEVQQLGDQFPQLQAALVGLQYLVVDVRGDGAHLQQHLHLPDDEGERGAELVGDIGEEAQLGLIELLDVFGMLLLVLQRFLQLDAAVVGAHQVVGHTGDAGQVEQVGPRGAVEGRKHLELNAAGRHQALVRVLGLDHQGVLARVQVGVGDDVLFQAVPRLREAFQAVDYLILVEGDVVGRDILYAEDVLVGLQGDGRGVGDVLLQYAVLSSDVYLFSVDDEPEGVDAVGARCLFQVFLEEGDDSGGSPDEYFPLPVLEQRVLVDAAERQLVVVREALLRQVQYGESLVGGHEQAVGRKLAEVIYDVACQPVAVHVEVLEVVCLPPVEVQPVLVGAEPEPVPAVFVDGIDAVAAEALLVGALVLVDGEFPGVEMVGAGTLVVAHDPQYATVVQCQPQGG